MYILIPVKFISFHFKCVSSGCVFSGFYGNLKSSIELSRLTGGKVRGSPESQNILFHETADCTKKTSLVLSANIRTQVKFCSKCDGDTRLFYVPSPTAPLKHSCLPALNCMTSSAETPVTLQKDQSSERSPPPLCVCIAQDDAA